MKLKTIIALRELAANDLEAATATAEITREQLRQAQELLDQAEADGADEGTLAKYREDVRRQICLTLEEMGVQPERSHHEQGPGQNEVDFRCASPLQAADDLMTVHTVVKAIAGQNGLYASFLPKPLPETSGSGLHLNFSLLHGGRNVFENFQTAPDPLAAAFLAPMS